VASPFGEKKGLVKQESGQNSIIQGACSLVTANGLLKEISIDQALSLEYGV
jgi:hypothetical protein